MKQPIWEAINQSKNHWG